MQITLERQSKTIALSFNTDNSIAYDELYLAVQDKMSGIVNGGKFLAGVVGKAFTIVGNAVSVLSKNIYVQGLTVAAAGGLGSRLAGGSFELGFLTAGLAFAVNQVVTQLAQKAKALDSPVGNAPVSSAFRANRTCNPCSADHPGTDYAVPVGTDVVVTADGKVVRAYTSSTYGKTVIVDHGAAASGKGNVYTLYAHADALSVSQNQKVTMGQSILTSGNAGNSTGPHLHYEVIQTTSTPFQKGFFGNVNERYAPTDLKNLL